MASKGEVSFDDFYEIQLRGFKFLGCDLLPQEVPKTKKEKIKQKFQKSCFKLVVLCAVALIVGLITNIFCNLHNDETLIHLIVSLTSVPYILFKLLQIVKQKEQIYEILMELREMFLTTKDEQHRFGIATYKQNLLRIMTFYAIYYGSAIFFVIIFSIVNYIQNGPEKLPIIIIIPFNYDSGLSYLFASLWTAMGNVFGVVSRFSSDWILFAIIVNVSMEFDILKEKVKETLDSENVEIEDLKKLIFHHNHLIELCGKIEKIFSPSFFVCFIQSSFIIGVSCLNLAMTKTFSNGMLFAVRLTLILIQSFLPFYYGQKLIDSSASINNAIHESNWYLIKDLKIRKMTIMIIQMFQKPIELTAKGFRSISRDTFRAILTSAHQYMSFWRQIYLK